MSRLENLVTRALESAIKISRPGGIAPLYIESRAVVELRFFKIPPSFGVPKDFFMKKLFAISIFIAAITASASAQTINVCQHWIDNWRTHVGALPGVVAVPSTYSAAREWSVTAPTSLGSRTVSGDAWCTPDNNPPTFHNAGGSSGAHCWCRTTVPYVGPWVHATSGAGCSQPCMSCCAVACGRHCFGSGSFTNCTRAAILALP